MSHTTLRASLLAILLCTTPNAYAQDSGAKPSQESQEPRVSVEGDAAKAEELCARAEALSKQGDSKGALGASGEAVKLYARIYLDARTPAPVPASDAPARFRSEMAARLRRAPACVELYARLGGPEGATDFERGQLEALRAHAVGLTETDASRAIFFGPETDTRAVVTYKPEPRYPRGERGKNARVRVRLRVVLGADGEVRDAFVLSGSETAFAVSSIEAAKGTRFKPAVKDGRAVSQFVTLEYNFTTF